MFKRIAPILCVLSVTVFLLGILGSFYYPKAKNTPFKTKYVVVLVIDGARYSETFGDSLAKYTPNLQHLLKQLGVCYSHFYNQGPTFTIAGHTAITTGFYQKISNAGNSFPKKPSFFYYHMLQNRSDKLANWIFSGKGKLEVLTTNKSKKTTNEYKPMSYCGELGNSADYGSDNTTWEKVKDVFVNHSPTLSLINLLEADATAHQNDWEGYVNGIKNSDQKALELWQLIQSNPLMKNKTTLFITNDHGRHLNGIKDGFVNHGDGCMGCRHIMFLAIGPDFKKNVVMDTPAQLIDISTTVASLLHFSMPTSKGRVLNELFEVK
jgi:predicted AlkP superfamily pyrophosphatase or phosphodiesterase